MRGVVRPRNDVLVRGWNSHMRVAVARNTLSARSAMERHKLPIHDALPLGKLMASASLMASMLRGEERVMMDLQNSNTRYYAEAIAVGEVRAFAHRESKEEPRVLAGAFKSSELHQLAPDEGTLAVRMVMYDQATPYESIVPVAKESDVGEAMKTYFERSEQIGNLVEFEAIADESSSQLVFAGGLIANVLPLPDEGGTSHIEVLDRTRKRLQTLLPLHRSLDDASKEKDVEDFLAELLELTAEQRRTNLTERTRLDFFCRCSSDALRDRLLTLTRSELKEMRDAGVPELRCSYCNTAYTMKPDDFDHIIAQKLRNTKKIAPAKTKAKEKEAQAPSAQTKART